MKRCNRCNILKPLSEYYSSKTNSDGLRGYCKSCAKKAERKRYEKVMANKPNKELTINQQQIEIKKLKEKVEFYKDKINFFSAIVYQYDYLEKYKDISDLEKVQMIAREFLKG